MDIECNTITRLILPAVRIGLAEQMSSKYKMRQKEIAERLGIAQVAVSKYLNGKYSKEVRTVKDKISASGILDDTAKKVSATSNSRAVNSMVNELCAEIVSDNVI